MSAPTVVIDSKTKMRQNAIRIHFIFVVILGLVLLCPVMRLRSTLLQHNQMTQIRAGIVEKNSFVLGSLHHPEVASKWHLSPTKTGTSV